MNGDLGERSQAAQEILTGAQRLTPGQVRALSLRPVDAFSAERQAARIRARGVARDHGLVGTLDVVLRDAARAPEMPFVRERSTDAVRQVTADAAVAAFLADLLDEDTRRLLAGPWTRATRRR